LEIFGNAYNGRLDDENHPFFDPDQTLMPQLPFLDSLKPDQYGPRGF